MSNIALICSTVILGGVCMTCWFIGHRKTKHKKELERRLRESICNLLEQGVTTFLFGDHSEKFTPKFAEYTIGRIIPTQMST